MAKINSINNASSQLTIDPGASGDSFVQFDINAIGEFRIGVDDNASDAFKISQGSALGTNDTFVMTAAGERTMPLQPAFLVRIDGDVSNVTGDGTIYTLVYDAETFDVGSNFSTSTFTAPIAGKYFFNFSINLANVNTFTSVQSTIICSTAGSFQNQGYVIAGQNSMSAQMQLFVVLAASETVTTSVRVLGGSKTVDIQGNSGTGGFVVSFFSGVLIC